VPLGSNSLVEALARSRCIQSSMRNIKWSDVTRHMVVHISKISTIKPQKNKKRLSRLSTHVEWQEITRAERCRGDSRESHSAGRTVCRGSQPATAPGRKIPVSTTRLGSSRHECGGEFVLLLLLLSDIGSGARRRGGAEDDAWSCRFMRMGSAMAPFDDMYKLTCWWSALLR
jgi:hypothetical protein